MKSGHLSQYFSGVFTKILTRVDATPKSNQHEIGSRVDGGDLRSILGEINRVRDNAFEATYLLMTDDGVVGSVKDTASWYDSRRNNAKRSPEWRLYYKSNLVTEQMNEGDRVFIARSTDDHIVVIIVPPESSIEAQLLWLFQLGSVNTKQFDTNDDYELELISKSLLEDLGIEVVEEASDFIDLLVKEFGTEFPSTRIFSAFARSTFKDTELPDDSDSRLMAWLQREDMLFRQFEKYIVSSRLKQGFSNDDEPDVDGFIAFSLSVQNRRKSRAGYSLENHIEEILQARKIHYSRGATTENKSKPDFLFPGIEQYKTSSFPAQHLTMLASKSSCKDRWRQILAEAERIESRHLITLEPSISVPQTSEMIASQVQLILPHALHSTYKPDQQNWLWNFEQFLQHVEARQA